MTLYDFEELINEKQLFKGLEYYENKLVNELKEYEPGRWQAVVDGSEAYSVTIGLKKETIKDCFCDCPHEVEHCKHVVAVLYAIKEVASPFYDKGFNKIDRFTNNVKQKEVVADIVSTVPEKELRQFIIDQADINPEFKNIVIAYFSVKHSPVNTHLYAQVIKNAAKMMSDRHGFIDYYHAGKAIEPVYLLLEKAEDALVHGNFAVTTDIVFAVIRNVHDLMTEMDDSSGMAAGCIREGFSLLKKLCESNTSFDLKERIFREAEKEALDKKYDFAGFDESWIEILILAAYDRIKELQLLQAIDTMLSDLTKKADGWSYEYKMTKLLRHKLVLMRRLELYEEADTLRLKYLYLPEFRMDLIEEQLQKKEYTIVKQLIDDGISIAARKKNTGTIESYKEILLRMAFACNDIAAVRSVATELYGGSDMDYYRIIKKTYATDEWPAIAEGFIGKLQESNKTFYGSIGSSNDEGLAAIFIEEKYWQRLLELLQKSPHLDFVERYSARLAANYTGDLLEVYTIAIRNYAAQNTGRNHYIVIKNVLQKIKKWEGGAETVRQLIDELCRQYKTRKAMHEELRDVH